MSLWPIYKALHPREDVDRFYIKRKGGISMFSLRIVLFPHEKQRKCTLVKVTKDYVQQSNPELKRSEWRINDHESQQCNIKTKWDKNLYWHLKKQIDILADISM